MAKMGFERASEEEQARLGELLWDVHAAAMKIVEFTTGRDDDDFAGSEVLRSAVASMLGIVATSLRGIEAQFPDEFAKIGNGQRFLTADTLPPEKLWRLVEELVPELVADSRAVLEDWHGA